MGAWGTSIFANDLASDIKGDWREAIEDGLDPAAATERLIRSYEAVLADPDERPIFWISLAAAQAATGRLQDSVRDQALTVIQAGGDVERFAAEDARLGRQRALALERLAAQLRGPQRAPAVIKRPKPHPSPVAIGDAVLVHGMGDNPRDGLFVVISLTSGWPRGSVAPELLPLAWPGGEVPTVTDIGRLPFLLLTNELRRQDVIHCFMIQGPTRGPNAFPNFAEVVGSGISRPDAPPAKSRGVAYNLTSWRGLAMIVGGSWFARGRPSPPEHEPPVWKKLFDRR